MSNQASELLSYDIIGKECNISFHIIYYLFVCALPVQIKLCSSEQAVVLNLYKITEPRKGRLKVEILHDLKVFYNS